MIFGFKNNIIIDLGSYVDVVTQMEKTFFLKHIEVNDVKD